MKSKATPRLEGRKRRHLRIRAKVSGSGERPRLTVYRSLNHIYAQLVDDLEGRTLLSVSSRDATLLAEVKAAKGKVARASSSEKPWRRARRRRESSASASTGAGTCITAA